MAGAIRHMFGKSLKNTPDEGSRVGYLLSQYPTVNHTFILREIRALRRLGFDIVAVSIRNADRPVEQMTPDEAEEFALTYSIFGAGLGRMLAGHLRTVARHPVAYVRALIYALRLAGSNVRKMVLHVAYFAEAVSAGDYFGRRSITHIHTHFSSTVALIVKRLFHIEFSATIHGSGEFEDVVGFRMAEKVAQSTFIATIGKYGSSQVMKASLPAYWDKVHAVPLGIDMAEFVPGPRREDDRRFRILSVGQLAPAKAYPMLIAAAGRLVAQGRTEIMLTIIGEGAARTYLEQAIAREHLGAFVRLPGARNHRAVLDAYRETDAFALSSFAEGVPVVLMEAMAMEIPCVATWITGIPELIRPEVDGLLVPPADPDALAAAIARLMDQPELRLRLGKSARQRVAERYDVVRNTTQLAAVFHAYLNQPAKTAPAEKGSQA